MLCDCSLTMHHKHLERDRHNRVPESRVPNNYQVFRATIDGEVAVLLTTLV